MEVLSSSSDSDADEAPDSAVAGIAGAGAGALIRTAVPACVCSAKNRSRPCVWLRFCRTALKKHVLPRLLRPLTRGSGGVLVFEFAAPPGEITERAAAVRDKALGDGAVVELD